MRPRASGLFSIVFTAATAIAGLARGAATAAPLYDVRFEQGLAPFASVVTDPGNAFTGCEHSVRREGECSGKLALAATAERGYATLPLSPYRSELFTRVAFRIAPGFDPAASLELLSLLGADSTRPLASLVMDPDRTLRVVFADAGGTLRSASPAGSLDSAVPEGRWIEVELHYRAGSTPPASGIELYRDGARVLSMTAYGTAGAVREVDLGLRANWTNMTATSGTIGFDLLKVDDAALIGEEPDRAAAVIVDRSDAAAYADYASERVRGLLDHLGLSYIELDVSSRAFDVAWLSQFDLVVLGQDRLGPRLTAAERLALASAVQSGVGLVSFDYRADLYPEAAFQAMLGSPTYAAPGTTTQVKPAAPAFHFITAEQPAADAGRTYNWATASPYLPLTSAGGATVLATSFGVSSLACRAYGSGRVVWWFLGSEIWDGATDSGGSFLTFGHVHGLDDVAWRGLAWAARKPFAWRPMDRKYVSLKIDDGKGRSFGGSAPFDYLGAASDVLSVPVHASVFLDDVSADPARVAALAALRTAGKSEVSVHGFTGGDTNPIEPSDYFAYWDWPSDAPFPPATLASNWTAIDAFLSENSITPSKTFAPHQAVAGSGNVPYLAARGITFANTFRDFGTTAGTGELDWAAAPYASGCHALDFMGSGSNVFAVTTWSDCVFWDFDFDLKYQALPLQPVTSTGEAVSNALFQARKAHGSRFPMILLTHEYVMQVTGFDLASWTAIVLGIRDGLAADPEIEWLGTDALMAKARDFRLTRILSYRKAGGQLNVLVEGTANGQTAVEVWDTGEVRHRAPIPAFVGTSPLTYLGSCGGVGPPESGVATSVWPWLLPWAAALGLRKRILPALQCHRPGPRAISHGVLAPSDVHAK